MKNTTITTAHTPGPWEIERIYTENEVVGAMTILGNDGGPIAKTSHSLIGRNRPTPEIVANARLIAAAPELLEAIQFLEMIASTCFDTSNPKLPEAWRDGIMNARAAIEKATGDNDQEPDETAPLETYKGFDIFETGGRKLTAYEKNVPNHPRTVVAYSLPDIKNLIDYMTEDDEAAEPDSDNQARDYQDAQQWAEQPTPYDP